MKGCADGRVVDGLVGGIEHDIAGFDDHYVEAGVLAAFGLHVTAHLQQVIGSSERCNAARNLDMKLIGIREILTPGYGRTLGGAGMKGEAGEVVDRTVWPFAARNPFWIGEDVVAKVHGKPLGDVDETARGIG